MPQNDTWGPISELQLAELRKTAQSCATCGMLATIDPVLHQSRYRHVPEYRDAKGLHRWNKATMSWDLVNEEEKSTP